MSDTIKQAIEHIDEAIRIGEEIMQGLDEPSVSAVPSERGAGGPTEMHELRRRELWHFDCSCGETFDTWGGYDQHAIETLRAALSAATEQIKTLESLNILKVLEQDESAAITENLLLHDQLADAQGEIARLKKDVETGVQKMFERLRAADEKGKALLSKRLDERLSAGHDAALRAESGLGALEEACGVVRYCADVFRKQAVKRGKKWSEIKPFFDEIETRIRALLSGSPQ